MGKARAAVIPEIDQCIRQGKAPAARRAIQDLARHHLDREDAVRLASLARRAGLALVGLRLLNPIVRPEPNAPRVPSGEEKLEYAACLVKIGAGKEAKGILDSLDPEALPQVYLFTAFALFSQWDYAEAIPLLLNYVRASGLTRYQRMVGQANLAEACVYEGQYAKAEPILQELLFEASVRKLNLLLGKTLELSAQNFLLQGKMAKAEQFLSQAQSRMAETDTLDEFFVRKWKAILEFRRRSTELDALEGLHRIRAEALDRRHWESARACDRFEAVLRGDEHQLTHLYFGSPYDGFRRRLLADFPRKVDLPDAYQWCMGAKSAPLVLDLRRDGENDLRAGHLLHRLMALLSSDFYRPFRVASLHSSLYPGEFFNPVSSPARIHDALRRLRGWFVDRGVPLAIEEEDCFYRLTALEPSAIRVSVQTLSKVSLPLERLREAFASAPFSTDDASRALGLAYRTAHRLLQSARAQGNLVRLGKGRSTRYAFPR